MDTFSSQNLSAEISALVALVRPGLVAVGEANGLVRGLGNYSWMGRMRRDLIQVDVSLAPGNSGGPILDANAQMIGIACMIASPGMALVIPTRTIERFVAELTRRRSRAA